MNTKVWLIRFTDSQGITQSVARLCNAIAEYRQIDPAATVQELDVLALAELLEADKAFDQVVADIQARNRSIAETGGYVRLEMPGTRELCERYVRAEMARTDAIERCIGVVA